MLSSTKNFLFDNISRVGIPGLKRSNSNQTLELEKEASSQTSPESKFQLSNAPVITHFDVLSQDSKTGADEGVPPDEQSFYSAKDNNDSQNASLLSYTQHAYDKSKIGENNLCLNIAFSLCCILASLAICFFQLEWFKYEVQLTPSITGMNTDPAAHRMQFYVSVFKVRVEPSGAVHDMPDFFDRCASLANQSKDDFAEVCASVHNMNRCFIVFLVFMVLHLLFHLHSLVTVHLIIKQRTTPPALNDSNNSVSSMLQEALEDAENVPVKDLD